MEDLRKDPRYYQIIILSSLLAYGFLFLSFDISFAQIATIFATALVSQFLLSKIIKIKAEYKSAIITSLSLCLLLRTNFIWIAALAAYIAIASKFSLRVNNKHIFNPANIAIILTIIATDNAWVSPGQWGSDVLLAFLFACMGIFVISKAARSGVSIIFLLSYATILFTRALWLGDPLAIPFHQLQTGALLLFAFFMISDPKTMPDAQIGRVIFAILTAVLAAIFQFMFYNPIAVIYALPIVNILSPVIDKIFKGEQYKWRIS